MAISCETLITGVHLAGCPGGIGDYLAVERGMLAVAGGRILYAGAAADAPAFDAAETIDGAGAWLTPGLVDCHTHLVWGGSRAEEFERRLAGESYEEIARAGGGILSTVRATRAAGEEELLAAATARLARLCEEGVTTIEVKSGYGLHTATELKLLRVARRLEQNSPVTVKTTLLGAHALPREYSGRADAYIDLVCEEMIPAAAAEGLADAVDVFCEHIGFSVEQCERVFAAARSHGLPVKAHAEQLSDSGGAALASRFGALSADHLEYLAANDVAAMAAAGTVAVLLPGAFYFLAETRRPPVAALREAGVPMAVATDLNPGTSPLASLLAAMNLACVCFGLTPAESFAGTTRHAAAALGLADTGVLAEGCRADLCLWPVSTPAELSYGMNLLRPTTIWQAGRRVAGG